MDILDKLKKIEEWDNIQYDTKELEKRRKVLTREAEIIFDEYGPDEGWMIANILQELIADDCHKAMENAFYPQFWCKLSRKPENCSIFKNTTGGCKSCGHYK